MAILLNLCSLIMRVRLLSGFKSNHAKVDVIVINAAAYTHTSIAIHDALKSYSGYKVELHISNPHLRESFRHVSFISPAVDAVIAGLGAEGYGHVVDLLSELPIKVN